MGAAGPNTDYCCCKGRDRYRLPTPKHEGKAEGQGGGRCDSARSDGKISHAEKRRKARRQRSHDGNRMVATACAAMPSRRPVKPRPSLVVAFTLTRASSI